MNNDGETSITGVSDYHCEKFLRFLPAGQTEKGFRARPLIQFYRDRYTYRGRDGFGHMHTICPDDIIRVKGFTEAQIKQRIIQIRRGLPVQEEKPPKVRRRKQLKK
jgi:hypothetical protein